eukprot:scaffold29_cov204-Chaetoceros_neogracile.AAC.2
MMLPPKQRSNLATRALMFAGGGFYGAVAACVVVSLPMTPMMFDAGPSKKASFLFASWIGLLPATCICSFELLHAARHAKPLPFLPALFPIFYSLLLFGVPELLENKHKWEKKK